MTPESRNSPLLANGSLTQVSVSTSWNSPVLSNGSVSTFPWQRINREKQNNRGTVRHGDLHSVRLEVSSVVKGVVIQSSNPSTVTLRVVGGDENGSLESETVKYGHEFYGTRTRKWLRWRGQVAIANDRPGPSSERAPQINKPATVRQ
jgi:hypothetical protein